MRDINQITLVGRLTRDPELRALPSGTAVCSMRVAYSTTRKDASTGDFIDKSNYVDVTVFGRQGESSAKYLAKGRQLGVQGRLEWSEWQDQQGNKRQKHEIVADHIQFLDGGASQERAQQFTGGSDIPADFGTPTTVADPAPQPQSFGVPGAADDDDIPFAHDGFPNYSERREHRSRW